MILYFSATGNTKFVAEELAKRMGDKALNLRDRIRQNNYEPIHSDRPFVICSPVYVCEMPRFFTAFIKKTTFTGCRDVYFVFTSGGYAGVSSFLAREIVHGKHMRYMGCAELKMPRNYIANNTYPELETAEIEKRIRDSYEKIPAIADTILSGGRLKPRHVWLFEILITLPFNPVWCHTMQSVKDFYATDNCISCGKCRQVCPLNVIQLDKGKKPIWNKNSCAHCMACIQNCPVEAIEYGRETQQKRRYRFDKYKYVIQ